MVTAAGPLRRVVFFGTPAFAVPTLEALLRSRHPVAGVVTQPDRPRGRGHKTTAAPVKALAAAAGVPVLQPQRLQRRSVSGRAHGTERRRGGSGRLRKNPDRAGSRRAEARPPERPCLTPASVPRRGAGAPSGHRRRARNRHHHHAGRAGARRGTDAGAGCAADRRQTRQATMSNAISRAWARRCSSRRWTDWPSATSRKRRRSRARPPTRTSSPRRTASSTGRHRPSASTI